MAEKAQTEYPLPTVNPPAFARETLTQPGRTHPSKARLGGIPPAAAAEWQVAMEALILVATLGGPTMMARITPMRALNRHDPSKEKLGKTETEERPMNLRLILIP